MADPAFVYAPTAIAVPQYADHGSGANEDLSCFFQPSAPISYQNSELSARLGQRPQSGYPDTSFVCPLLFFDADDTSPIKGGSDWWASIWNDAGSKKADDFSVWEVKLERIPSGYICLSPCFFKKKVNGHASWEPPSDEDVQGMVAVREHLVKYVEGGYLSKVWDDRGTHAAKDVSIYTGPDNLGTFAFPNYDAISSNANFPVLDTSKGKQISI